MAMVFQTKSLHFSPNPEPVTTVLGGPEMFVESYSMINLTCLVTWTARPPNKVMMIMMLMMIMMMMMMMIMMIMIMMIMINLTFLVNWTARPPHKFTNSDRF